MTVGVVAALPAETQAFRRRRDRQNRWQDLGAVILACSGVGPERAERAAIGLLDHGVSGLISWGSAGGLAPEISPGDLLLPREVRDERGLSWPCHPAWRLRIEARVAGALPVHSGVQLSCQAVVASSADKKRLLATGALAVDMESAAIAEVARAARIPFIVIRAVCDPANRAIPQTALAAIDAEGRFRPWNCMWSLLTRPGDLSALLRLRSGLRAVQATLAEVIQLVDGLEGLEAG